MSKIVIKPYKLYYPETTAFVHDGLAGDEALYLLAGEDSKYGLDFVEYGDDVKDYRRAIKGGNSATTFLNAQTISVGQTDDYCAFTLHNVQGNYDQKWIYNGPLSIVGAYSIPNEADVDLLPLNENEALEKFTKQVISKQRTLQALVSVGEIGETIHMMRNPLKSLFSDLPRYLGDLRKKTRPRKNRKSLQTIIADTWLENSFGWQPLISDVQDGAKAAARINGFSPPYKKCEAGVQDSRKAEPVRVTGSPGGVLHIEKQCIQTWNVSIKFTGKVAIAAAPTFTTDQLGLSLRDLAPTLWELIPYSFLIDYFTNVGSIIDALSLRSCDIKWVERGVEFESNSTHQATRSYVTTGFPWVVTSMVPATRSFTVTRRQVSRGNYTGSLIPHFDFRIPGSSMKWMNIHALGQSSREMSARIARRG